MGQKSKFWSKIDILVKNKTHRQKSQFETNFKLTYKVPHASPCTTDDDVTIDKVSTVPVVTRRASSPNIKCRSSTSLRQSTSRLRQDLPSGTYDRYGRPTLKPVYSGIFGKKSTVDASISVQSLVSVRPKSAMTQTCSEPNLIPDFIPERKAGQKSAATQTVGDTGSEFEIVFCCIKKGFKKRHFPRKFRFLTKISIFAQNFLSQNLVRSCFHFRFKVAQKTHPTRVNFALI